MNGKRGYYVGAAMRREDASQETEPFVSVVHAEPVDDLQNAVNQYNQSPYGQSASVFTRSKSIFSLLAEELPAGNLAANLPTRLAPSSVPFWRLGTVPNGTEFRLLFDVFLCDQGDGPFFWGSGFANSLRRAFA